jgi:hypothetical protein
MADVVRQPNVQGASPDARTRSLQSLYNQNRTELFMVESRMIGHRIEPGSVRLIHLNNVPEMVTSLDGPREFPVVKGLDMREDYGVCPESRLFYGAKGMFVVNVPQGKFALAYQGQEPLILDQGTHVIASPNLQEITERSLVDQSDFSINHGNLHIIRVPPGRVACITLRNQPYILESRREPYVFKNALFSFNSASDFADCGAPYIRNGSLHVLQVPKGKVATVWVGAKPALLYHRNQPYVILDNLFRLEPRANPNAKQQRSSEDLFFSSNAEVIRHGSVKRIIPRTGFVAVIYENGHLQVRPPPPDGEPIIIDSESSIVLDMFNCQKQVML